jgi:hypothetical protein
MHDATESGGILKDGTDRKPAAVSIGILLIGTLWLLDEDVLNTF